MEETVSYGNQQKPERTSLERYRDLVEWISVYARHASKSPDGLSEAFLRDNLAMIADKCGHALCGGDPAAPSERKTP